MIRNVLEHIRGVASLPAVALILFVAVFVGMTIWALRLRPGHVNHMSHLPLEDDQPRNSEGAPRT